MIKIFVDTLTGYEIVKENIYNCQTTSINIDSKYHHNCDYKDAASIINNGILSYSNKQLLNGTILTKEQKIKLNEEGHVNGTDLISLSSLKINYDELYKDEWLYDPFISSSVDILISGEVKAYRSSINYANEFLAKNKISNEYFESIDIRLLKNINDNKILYKDNSYEYRLSKVIEYYNYLKDIAVAISNNNLDIPLREMSEENITLDVNKVKDMPKIYLKK